jgi:hypothetical protein
VKKPHDCISLISQVPRRDFEAIRFLEARGILVTVLWTNNGWRYQVRFP